MARILVVDDDTSVLEATALALTRAGHEVETTSDVFGLPLRVGAFKPDAILLDYDLPALTGDKLATNLRALRSAQSCKVIFHSAEDEQLLATTVEKTGAVGYIPKGLPRAELLRRLRHFLDG
jgi:two-component system, OmpR family, response regulator